VTRRFYLPMKIDWPDQLTSDQRNRLEKVIVGAIQRAAQAAGATAETQPAERGNQEETREPFSTTRLRPEGDAYGVPSYAEGGTETEVEIIDFADDVVTGAPDRVIEGEPPFQGVLVMSLPGNRYIKVESHRYAVSTDIGRAYAWAKSLFGAEAWTIVAGSRRPGEVYYYAAALDTPLTSAELGVQGSAGSAAAGAGEYFAGRVQEDIPHGYVVQAVGFRGGGFSASNRRAFEAFVSQVRESREQGTAAIDPGELRASVFAPIDALIAHGGDPQRAADLLSELDATAFATLDWETKARYLTVLIQAWTLERQEIAIVEIVKSMSSRSELDAALGMLRLAGVYNQMFDDLDSQVWSLLVESGRRFGEPGTITLDELVKIMQDAGLLPRSLEDALNNIVLSPAGPVIPPAVLAEVEEAARGFVRFVGGALEGIWMIISHPEKLIDAVGQLGKMIVMVELAKWGYQPAVRYMDTLLSTMGQQVVYGLKGAAVLGVSDPIMRRIKWAIVWEIASWFIGVGEIKAILEGAEVGQKLAALARFLRVLGLLGRAAEAEQVASKMEHLVMLLSKISSVTREDEILRLMSHLPEEDLLRLGRRLEQADVHAAQSMVELAGRHPELAEAANHAIRRTEALARLEQRAGQLSENIVAGFQRLASRGGLDHEELLQVINAVQRENAELFMRAVRAIPDRALGPGIGTRSANFFARLAERPQSMRFLIEANYDTFSALYRGARYDFARLEETLNAVEDVVRRLPSEQRAIEYRRLLDRLVREDTAAAEEIRNAINARRAARGAPLLRSYSAAELDEIVRNTADIREIRRLASQMDNSSAGSLFERWVHRYVFDREIGARRMRLFVRNGDNPHMERLMHDRISDVYYEPDGSVWDAKLYQSGAEIDLGQLDDYRKMEEAGHIITADGQRLPVKQINYVFSDRVAAEANVAGLHVQGGAEAWYIDNHGVLQHLQ
jgi:hypothetical protein